MSQIMVHEIKIVISEKGKVIDTIVKETNTEPTLLHKSLEEFRLLANAAMSKLILESGDSEDNIEDSSNETDDEEICPNPKRKKQL